MCVIGATRVAARAAARRAGCGAGGFSSFCARRRRVCSSRRRQAKRIELIEASHKAKEAASNPSELVRNAAASTDQTGRLACEEVAAGLALVNDLLTATTRLWQDDESMCERLTPAQLAG